MRKRLLNPTLFFLAFATIGTVAVQWLWIRNALVENRRQFDARVQAMLTRVATRFERQEALMTFSAATRVRQGYSMLQPGIDSVHHIIDSLRRLRADQYLRVQGSGDYESGKPYLGLESTIRELESIAREQARQARHFSEWLQFEYQVQRIPLSDRVVIGDLPGIVERELSMENLGLPLEYAVRDPRAGQAAFATKRYFELPGEAHYQVSLYPSLADAGQQPLLLAKVPGRGRALAGPLRWLLLASAVFAATVVWAFWRTATLFARQKEADAIKNDFINNMTHEFRTPIATINLAADALRSVMEKHDVPHGAFPGIIKQESERMHRHIERILQLAHLEKGDVALNIQDRDIAELARSVVSGFRLRAAQRGGHLADDLGDAPVVCPVDTDHFVNSVYNLLDNALKYNVDKPEITLSVGVTAAGEARLAVRDNGIGIDKEAAKRIFEKFYRAPTGNTHNVKGFGLGLSYVKLVTEKMGGRVEVDSAPGQGSTFCITLPLSKQTLKSK